MRRAAGKEEIWGEDEEEDDGNEGADRPGHMGATAARRHALGGGACVGGEDLEDLKLIVEGNA